MSGRRIAGLYPTKSTTQWSATRSLSPILLPAYADAQFPLRLDLIAQDRFFDFPGPNACSAANGWKVWKTGTRPMQSSVRQPCVKSISSRETAVVKMGESDLCICVGRPLRQPRKTAFKRQPVINSLDQNGSCWLNYQKVVNWSLVIGTYPLRVDCSHPKSNLRWSWRESQCGQDQSEPSERSCRSFRVCPGQRKGPRAVPRPRNLSMHREKAPLRRSQAVLAASWPHGSKAIQWDRPLHRNWNSPIFGPSTIWFDL